MKRNALVNAMACAVLLSLIVSGFQTVAATGVTNDIADTYALVFNDGAPSGAIPAQFKGINIVETYGTFTYAKLTKDQISQLRAVNIIVQEIPNAGKIKFDTITFDTASGDPALPEVYTASAPAPGVYGQYIVQVKGPTKKSWIDSMENAGGRILDILGYNAYIIEMTPSIKQKVSSLDFVSWSGLYQPYYKLRNGIQNAKGSVEMNVVFFKDSDFTGSLVRLEKIGAKVDSISTWGTWMDYAYIRADISILPQVAALPGVWYIEPADYIIFDDLDNSASVSSISPGNDIMNYQASWVIQSGVNGSRPIWDKGLHGENLVIGHGDTGIDFDHAAFTNAVGDKGTPSMSHRKIVRYWATGTTLHSGTERTHPARLSVTT
jgi:hypothetical protein